MSRASIPNPSEDEMGTSTTTDPQELLEGKLPSTSDLATQIVALREEADEERFELTRLQARTDEVALEGDVELDEHEARVRASERRIRRLDILIPKLEARLEEAVALDTTARLDKRIQEGRRLSKRADEIVDRYRAASGEIVRLLEELEAVNDQIEGIQREATSAGRPEEAPAPRGDALYSLSLPSFTRYRTPGGGDNAGVRLPDPDNRFAMIFGAQCVEPYYDATPDPGLVRIPDKPRVILSSNEAGIHVLNSDGSTRLLEEGETIRYQHPDEKPNQLKAGFVGEIPVIAPDGPGVFQVNPDGSRSPQKTPRKRTSPGLESKSPLQDL